VTPRVETASAADVLDLRTRVLRDDTPSDDPAFDGDDDPTTAHLVIRDGTGTIVATSTWLDRPFPDEPGAPAVQLRGMAVNGDARGQGLGAALVAAGIERARARGARVAWANARDTALRFYNANGFATVGDGFVTSDTRLPHHRVVRRL
jgi:predicted GNAT family N-acyltransferase